MGGQEQSPDAVHTSANANLTRRTATGGDLAWLRGVARLSLTEAARCLGISGLELLCWEDRLNVSDAVFEGVRAVYAENAKPEQPVREEYIAGQTEMEIE